MREPTRSFRWDIITGIVCLVGCLCLVSLAFIPSCVRGGPTRVGLMKCNLMKLDGAMSQWALEHHQTGAVAVTWEDLSPYLGGTVEVVAGERYSVTSLGESPEAQLARKVGTLPKGTVLRLGTNNDLEIVLPN